MYIPYLQMDTATLDESQHMTVRCRYCRIHYPLRSIQDHMDSHSHATDQEVSAGNNGKTCIIHFHTTK